MKYLLLLLLIACAHKAPTSGTSTSSDTPAVATPQPQRKDPVPDTACGLEGALDKRIESCDQTRGNFVLVRRTGTEEIYRDLKSGRFWGPRLKFDTNFYGAGKVCDEMDDIELGIRVRWRLPTLAEFVEAHNHGLPNAFTDMNHWFWTSTYRGRKLRRFTAIKQWKGAEGEQGEGLSEEAASVRCIGSL